MISKKEAEDAAHSDTSDAQKNVKNSKKLGRSPKHQALLDTIDTMATDEKGVIFSQWTSHLDLIEVELFRAGETYTRIDGSMSAEARLQAMEAFDTQKTDTMKTPRFILCSLMACGTGINLTRGYVCLVFVVVVCIRPHSMASLILSATWCFLWTVGGTLPLKTKPWSKYTKLSLKMNTTHSQNSL